MPFPDHQLETWAHQGSVTQSASTYATVKDALQRSTGRIFLRDYDIFLQGSYGNSTNIWAESDVDIVIKLKETFYSNAEDLPPPQYIQWRSDTSPVTYDWPQFKQDVYETLRASFGADVSYGGKAISVAARNGRRKVDVVVATSYRKYLSYDPWNRTNYVEGICFWTSLGDQIVNFPRQHSESLTTKHQATGRNFKPLVRIVKNMRSRMQSEGFISEGVAPSYFIEGMLYNVPHQDLGTSNAGNLVAALNWLNGQASLPHLMCANHQSRLIGDNDSTRWPLADAATFLQQLIAYWNRG
ncbi:nucleotidyltransferase [Pseudoxanthomonas sp. PXM02]|uniref:nucleotidyltransferase domain-containing protein n=1 Tax=Pseudoxanthomonas sp. PXM02 TaxID=2769294 RepID=UPI0017852B01|nr:nucleotidyltransferase [Pseudoxanthomonas sp. PXM02]MBD9478869.1 nucleotidyltransferase [Pseudoxanthomonas sp. PXM02]